MDFQPVNQNPRTEELFLIIGDRYRSTNKLWFKAALIVLIAALPLYFLMKFAFTQIFVSAIEPVRIIYQQAVHLPLEVIEKKIFDLGDGTYSGYVRVKNNNSEWGVPEQGYRFEFKTTSGSLITGTDGATFILPFSEKLIVFPRFSSSTKPDVVNFVLKESNFIRPPNLPPLDFEIQRRSLDLQTNQTAVNAVIVNRTPFKVSRVDMPVLLYDNQNQIIGVNYTNINDLESSESRSFQYVWYNRINNVARVEIIPEINIYNKDIFVTGPGANPFDNIE
ncbi:MAG TPA: FxLYD domain-containing protein [Candidatus Binatia bacterium]|nr:FxLYD domain-containing protein [Candidatus Binatia bacterium]